MSTMEAPSRIASSGSGSKKSSKKGKGGSDDEGGAKAKGGKKKLIIIAVVLLLAAGGAAKFTILAPKPLSAAAAAKVKPTPGPVVPMDELTLNLAGGHFLRLKMSIELTKGGSADMDLTEGVQAVIDEYSNKTVAELTGVKARTKAKDELVAALQKIYPKKILDAMYGEFVMQ